MPLPIKKKPPGKDDFADLLGDAPSTGDTTNADEEFEDVDTAADDFDDGGDDLGIEDGLDEDMGASDSGIDPEVAGLCARLGFTDPDKQQALVDLVKLVTAPAVEDDMTGDLGGDPMALGSSSGMGY